MTPQQKIKHLILLKAKDWSQTFLCDVEITQENIDEIYQQESEDYALQDQKSEIRVGVCETDLKCEWSRHYESKAVAAKYLDGSWVGWTYWYGGGKHGEPEAISWIEDAYDVDCVEEEKLVVVRTFSAKETP